MYKTLNECDIMSINAENRVIWDANASTWNDAMSENGNRWHRELIAPKTLEFLELTKSDTVLDIGCGNGIFSRKLRSYGMSVVAFDFSEKNIEYAECYNSDNINYSVLDATDYDQLISLGVNRYEKAVANMVLMDIPTIEPLFRAMEQLLSDDGIFVFSIQHPCFVSENSESITRNVKDQNGKSGLEQEGVGVFDYSENSIAMGEAIEGQPEKQFYFHRSLSIYLQCAFKYGFSVDGIHEPTFQTDNDELFSRIPPVIIVRLRKAT